MFSRISAAASGSFRVAVNACGKVISHSGALLHRRIALWGSALAAFLLLSLWQGALASPAQFPTNMLVKIKKGETLSEVAGEFEQLHIVRSTLAFKTLLVMLGGERGVIAGSYVFHEPATSFTIARLVTSGAYGLELRRVTIPEGLNNTEVAAVLKSAFIDFDDASFLIDAKPYEGYLFPDTYFFYEDVTPTQVITAMRSNFDEHLKGLSPDIAAFGRPLSQIIIMASLVEEEARTPEVRKTIAGILWKRLDKKMPLQVDAVFTYLLGKSGLTLTSEDLTTNSPYNTYTHAGFPPGPIANPGSEAISDALHPIATPYYFYITDRAGLMHYATTYAQHKANIAAYLR